MSTRRQRARPLLGTIVEISVVAEDVGQADLAIGAAFSHVERIHNQMSFHDPLSELSELNRRGFIRPTPDLKKVLRFAQDIYRATEGAVNVAVAKVLIDHAYLPPSESQFVMGNSLDYEINETEIRFKKPIGVDLGGIAKGYAVDLAIEELQRLGISSAIVMAGGDLRAYGELRDFFVRNPLDPRLLDSFAQADDIAMATSASYFSNPEAHLHRLPYVTSDGSCIEEMPSITVLAPTCMIADALTKYVLFKSPSPEQLEAFSAVSVVRRT